MRDLQLKQLNLVDSCKLRMVDVPLRTRNILIDAKKLEKDGFYLASILLYIQYLEHVMLVATIQYHEYHKPEKINHKLEQIFQIKDSAQLNFGKILSLLPKKSRDAKTKKDIKYIQTIRNTIAAHSFFIVSLDKKDRKKRAVKDVNNYKKIIRRMYRLIRNEYPLHDVEVFLYRYPFPIRRDVEEYAYAIEKIILEKICQVTRETVLDAAGRISALSQPFGKFLPLD